MLIIEPEILPFDSDSPDPDGDGGYGVAPEPKRILWSMKLGDGRQEVEFEQELALATLLLAEKVFLNSPWWKEAWPEEARKSTCILAACNDIFAWGCADAEEVDRMELESLWKHHTADPTWGVVVWCLKKRRMLPQAPVRKIIEREGIWDLQGMHLRANSYDALCSRWNAERGQPVADWENEGGGNPGLESL